MEGKENILKELQLVSGLIAGLPRGIPYVLPDGYFDTLPGRVLDRINSRTEAGNPGLLDSINPDSQPFLVPTGYFEGFAGKLMDRIRSSEGVAPDQTPLDELTFLSPLLSRIDKKMPFEVPEDYFAELSPLLTAAKTTPVYQVPEGYFDGLGDSILEKLRPAAIQQQPAPAKIISFGRRRNWLKYAAAAVVAGMILTGGWLKWYNNAGNTTSPPDINKDLSNISDQEIENYLDNQNIALPDDLANSTASLDISDNDIKSLLGDVSDGELKQYVDEHGDTKELATN